MEIITFILRVKQNNFIRISYYNKNDSNNYKLCFRNTLHNIVQTVMYVINIYKCKSNNLINLWNIRSAIEVLKYSKAEFN